MGGGSRDFLYTLGLHLCTASAIVNTPRVKHLLHLMNPLAYHYHLKSIVYIRVHCCTFYGFWQIYNMSIHHYCIIQTSFTALKSSVLHLFISPLPLTLEKQWSFYFLHHFAFPEWHIVGIIKYAAFSGAFFSLVRIFKCLAFKGSIRSNVQISFPFWAVLPLYFSLHSLTEHPWGIFWETSKSLWHLFYLSLSNRLPDSDLIWPSMLCLT